MYSATNSTNATIVKAGEGESNWLLSIGARYIIDGVHTGSAFSLVEHPMPPRALAAPLHRHTREDEYSFVIEGRIGALLGDEVVYAEAGDVVFKPRNQWHTFWNASDSESRILEIIAPAGFEDFFRGMATTPPEELDQLADRYGLEMDMSSIPGLLERFDLTMPDLPGS